MLPATPKPDGHHAFRIDWVPWQPQQMTELRSVDDQFLDDQCCLDPKELPFNGIPSSWERGALSGDFPDEIGADHGIGGSSVSFELPLEMVAGEFAPRTSALGDVVDGAEVGDESEDGARLHPNLAARQEAADVPPRLLPPAVRQHGLQGPRVEEQPRLAAQRVQGGVEVLAPEEGEESPAPEPPQESVGSLAGARHHARRCDAHPPNSLPCL